MVLHITKLSANENGKPIDYVFLKINSAFENNDWSKADDIIGRTLKEVLPNTEKYGLIIMERLLYLNPHGI